MTISGLARLRAPKKDWDMALIFIRNRQPVGIEPSTRVSIEGGIVSIESADTPDPFYDPRDPNAGTQPKACTMTITVDIVDIVTVDYIVYDKVIKAPGIITGMGTLGKA